MNSLENHVTISVHYLKNNVTGGGARDKRSGGIQRFDNWLIIHERGGQETYSEEYFIKLSYFRTEA